MKRPATDKVPGVRRSNTRLPVMVGTAAAIGGVTHGLIPRLLGSWGATQAEQTAQLAGDEFIPAPESRQTMAITIDARPDEVWPWLIQMGVDRAGLYSYTWVENGLLRLGVVNADRIHPEWQDLKLGDIVAFTPGNYPGGRTGPEVIALEKYKALILNMSPGAEPGTVTGTWQFVLKDPGDGTTRLLLRSQSVSDRPLMVRIMDFALQPGYLIMERAMLRGIRARAERTETIESANNVPHDRKIGMDRPSAAGVAGAPDWFGPGSSAASVEG